jgi:hypothetical protein
LTKAEGGGGILNIAESVEREQMGRIKNPIKAIKPIKRGYKYLEGELKRSGE